MAWSPEQSLTVQKLEIIKESSFLQVLFNRSLDTATWTQGIELYSQPIEARFVARYGMNWQEAVTPPLLLFATSKEAYDALRLEGYQPSKTITTLLFTGYEMRYDYGYLMESFVYDIFKIPRPPYLPKLQLRHIGHRDRAIGSMAVNTLMTGIYFREVVDPLRKIDIPPDIKSSINSDESLRRILETFQ